MPYTTHNIGLPANASRLGRTPFRPAYPNPPDFPFNYCHFLEQATKPGAIAKATNPNRKIAIIGAGAAGLLAARELYRCGFNNIRIYEASDRIGGRLWSIPVRNSSNELTQEHTTFEMGAMRMPFFTEKNPPRDKPLGTNSILAYLVHEFKIKYQPFPDPGGDVADTGIYINDGRGPTGDNPPGLLMWPKGTGKNTKIGADGKEYYYNPPPTSNLRAVYDKWWAFQTAVSYWALETFDTDGWPAQWSSFADYYGERSFGQLVYSPLTARRILPRVSGGVAWE